jgi:hypothetical protein
MVLRLTAPSNVAPNTTLGPPLSTIDPLFHQGVPSTVEVEVTITR